MSIPAPPLPVKKPVKSVKKPTLTDLLKDATFREAYYHTHAPPSYKRDDFLGTANLIGVLVFIPFVAAVVFNAKYMVIPSFVYIGVVLVLGNCIPYGTTMDFAIGGVVAANVETHMNKPLSPEFPIATEACAAAFYLINFAFAAAVVRDCLNEKLISMRYRLMVTPSHAAAILREAKLAEITRSGCIAGVVAYFLGLISYLIVMNCDKPVPSVSMPLALMIGVLMLYIIFLVGKYFWIRCLSTKVTKIVKKTASLLPNV